MLIKGFFFDGQSSRRHPATLTLDEQRRLVVHYANQTHFYDAKNINIAPRLGKTARIISLPQGAQFESLNNDAIDYLQCRISKICSSAWLHTLESSYKWIATSIIVFLLLLYIGFTQGVPLAAQGIVALIPDTVDKRIGKQTLEKMQQSEMLLESQLSQERQHELLEHFAPLLTAHPNLGLSVHFHHTPGLGANAFALPNGAMVFTDSIVNLAQDNNELSAILVHEIGHIYHRHSMKRIVQNGLIYWGFMAITGDLSAASESIAIAPTLLMTLAYSRDMENEADEFALHNMRRQDIAPIHFANIMLRITKQDTLYSAIKNSKILQMISTHPETTERIKRFQTQQ